MQRFFDKQVSQLRVRSKLRLAKGGAISVHDSKEGERPEEARLDSMNSASSTVKTVWVEVFSTSSRMQRKEKRSEKTDGKL